VPYPRILRAAELVRLPEDQIATLVELPQYTSMATTQLPPGTLVTLEIRRPWWDRRPRKVVIASLTRVLRRLRTHEAVMVVAAAIHRDGRVLIAQRSHPVDLAGFWEFPGGKVEPGESLARALERECQEELGVMVTVGNELARERLPDGAWLVLFDCALKDRGGFPEALEHRALRWVDAAELGSADLLAANQPFVPAVAERLRQVTNRDRRTAIRWYPGLFA
jgi:8-oxo-dGTP diphosphatase